MPTLQDAVRKVAPKANAQFVESLTASADDAAFKYGVSERAVVIRFLANNHHETQGFTKFTEPMGYSAKRLMQVWPSRFPTLAAAQPFANNPEKLANSVYANRMGNGPPESGDGWRYRGGGLTHHTGKAEYARVRRRTGHDADLIRNPKNGVAMVEAAASYWFDRNVIEAARRGDDRQVTIRINGGLIGHEDRLVLTRRYTAAVTGGIIPKERTRAETAQRQRNQGTAAAGGAAAAGGGATVATTQPAPEAVPAAASPWLIGGGLLLAAALVGVAVILIRRAQKTEATLEAERQTIIDNRAALEG
jgi:putative chitinase